MCAILAARKQWLLLSIWCYRGGRCIRITWFATPLKINTCQMCFHRHTVHPMKYEHGFCFAVLCCGYTLTDFPISIRLTSLALWQSNDCPSASKATLMNMDKYFMWIHYERLHNHNKAKHNKTVCIFLGIYLSVAACFRVLHDHILLLLVYSDVYLVSWVLLPWHYAVYDTLRKHKTHTGFKVVFW